MAAYHDDCYSQGFCPQMKTLLLRHRIEDIENDGKIVNGCEEGSDATPTPVCMMPMVVESWLNESTEQFNLQEGSPPSTPWDACISDPPALRSSAKSNDTFETEMWIERSGNRRSIPIVKHHLQMHINHKHAQTDRLRSRDRTLNIDKAKLRRPGRPTSCHWSLNPQSIQALHN
jgi:hypothetical protein